MLNGVMPAAIDFLSKGDSLALNKGRQERIAAVEEIYGEDGLPFEHRYDMGKIHIGRVWDAMNWKNDPILRANGIRSIFGIWADAP